MAESAEANILSRFYSTWLNELAKALTPRRTGAAAWRVLALSKPDGLDVYSRASGLEKPIAALPAEPAREQITEGSRAVSRIAASDAAKVLLRLSPDDVVERIIQIPDGARDVIEPVLQNQMERIVPWSQDDTRHGYRIIGPNATSPEQLDIQLVATTKSVLDTALRRARSIGLEPYAIDYAADFSAPEVELQSLKPDPVKEMAASLHKAVSALVAVCVLIGGFGLYQMWGRQLENDDLDSRIATARSRVEKVKQLNQENIELRQQRERLVVRKRDEPAVITLIEAMSRALPDTAYLTEFEIHGREARIVGKSPDPTSLITKLEDTPQFEDVHFSSATTRAEGETTGTFAIISKAQGAPKEASQP